MPLGNTSYLQIPLMAESDNQKYLLHNNAIQALDDSLNRLLVLDFSGTDLTLTESQLTRYGAFRGFGNTLPRTLTIPASVGGSPVITTNRFFVFHNTGSDTITLTHGGAGAVVVVPSTSVALVLCDGTDVVSVASASGFDMGVRDEGGTNFVSNPTFMSFLGNNVAATLNGLGADVTISMPSVQDDAVGVQTDTTFFNFTGAGVTATVSGAGVDINIPGATSGVSVEDEGVGTVAAATVLNFVGNNVTVTDNAGDADITVTGAAVQDEGIVSQADPTFINFVGAGVTAVANGNGVDVTIAGGGSSGLDVEEEGVGTVTGATVMNFIGNNVTAADVGGKAHVTIQGAAVQDEGVSVQSDPTFVNFVGAGVTATANGNGVDVTIPASAGTAIPVDDDGVNIVTAADRLDFIGPGVMVAANGTTAEVTIAGNPLETQDDGTQIVANTNTINFTGAGVTTTNPSGSVTEVAIPGGGGAIPVKDDGVQIIATPTALDFIGAGVTVTNNGGEAQINIPGLNPLSGTAELIANIDCAVSSAATYDVTGVDGFDELIIIGRDLNLGADNVILRVSTDGGSSFIASNYSRSFLDGSGDGVAVATEWEMTGGTTTTPQGFNTRISAMGLPTPTIQQTSVVQSGVSTAHFMFSGQINTTAVVDAIRILSSAGANFTAGNLYVIGLRYGMRKLRVVEDTTTAYVVVDADLVGNVVHEQNNASANTVTINNTLTGSEPFTVVQKGVGQTTFVAGAGVTINSAGGLLSLSNQYSSATLIPLGSNSYYLVGDLV